MQRGVSDGMAASLSTYYPVDSVLLLDRPSNSSISYHSTNREHIETSFPNHKLYWVDGHLFDENLDSQEQLPVVCRETKSRVFDYCSSAEEGLQEQLEKFCRDAELNMALDSLFRMDHHPSPDAYQLLLRTCKDMESVYAAKAVHLHLAFHGLNSSNYITEYLISTLAACGSIEDALRIFQALPYRTAFVWTALISEYAANGDGRNALHIYRCMQEEDIKPTSYTFVSLFKVCIATQDLLQGKALHADAKRKSVELDAYITSTLVSMYGRCGSIKDAEVVFDSALIKDVVVWSAMLSSYLEQGESEKALQIYWRMQREGISPDSRSVVIALHACSTVAESEQQGIKIKSLKDGWNLHGDALLRGFDYDAFIASSLVNVYGKCGSILEAETVFNRIHQPSIVAWTALLHGYVEQEQQEKALLLYREVQECGIHTDSQFFVMIIQACCAVAEREDASVVENSAKSIALDVGCSIHAESLKNKFCLDVYVCSALISMYSKCRCINRAEYVFMSLLELDAVIWNAMLSAYVENDDGVKPLQLYREMQEDGMDVNEWTLVIALQACLILVSGEEKTLKNCGLDICKALHFDAKGNGLDSCDLVCRFLVTIYSKCACILDAENVFYGMASARCIATWNAMITAYIEDGFTEQASELVECLQSEDIHMDDVTLLCILQLSSLIGSVEICRQVHFTMASTIGTLSLLMATTLIHAYGSCAYMIDSWVIFMSLPEPDVVSWNALIAGYARDGNLVTSIQMFDKMMASDTEPDGLTFLPVLSVCNHAGLVDLGMIYLELLMQVNSITPDIEHYACIIDLFARVGNFATVMEILSRMVVQPDLSIWLCLLGSCKKHKNLQLGHLAFDQALLLDPEEPTIYILMSNLYADVGLHECAEQLGRMSLMLSANEIVDDDSYYAP